MDNLSSLLATALSVVIRVVTGSDILFKVTVGDGLRHVANLPTREAVVLLQLGQFVHYQLVVEVGKEVLHVHQTLKHRYLITALLDEAGLQVEVIFLVAGIGTYLKFRISSSVRVNFLFLRRFSTGLTYSVTREM